MAGFLSLGPTALNALGAMQKSDPAPAAGAQTPAAGAQTPAAGAQAPAAGAQTPADTQAANAIATGQTTGQAQDAKTAQPAPGAKLSNNPDKAGDMTGLGVERNPAAAQGAPAQAPPQGAQTPPQGGGNNILGTIAKLGGSLIGGGGAGLGSMLGSLIGGGAPGAGAAGGAGAPPTPPPAAAQKDGGGILGTVGKVAGNVLPLVAGI